MNEVADTQHADKGKHLLRWQHSDRHRNKTPFLPQLGSDTEDERIALFPWGPPVRKYD